MSDIKATYRGVEIPDKFGVLVAGHAWDMWREGVDAALGTAEKPAEVPEYDYFHDGDRDLNTRLYWRFKPGENRGEFATVKDWRWSEASLSRNWMSEETPIAYDSLPQAIKNT